MFFSLKKNKFLSKELEEAEMFYIISYPRSGNTWFVNSLSDYIGALRTEIDSIDYKCNAFQFTKYSTLVFGEPYKEGLPVGIKTHMTKDVFDKKKLPEKKKIYIYRDPRDVMISFYFYEYGYKQKDNENANQFSPEKFNEFLNKNLSMCLSHVTRWLSVNEKDILYVKYEDLQNNYKKELKKVKNFLKCKAIIKEDEVEERNVRNLSKMTAYTEVPKNELFKGDNTAFYRKGQVGDWKNYFNNEIKNEFKERAGQFLIDLGYEKDLKW